MQKPEKKPAKPPQTIDVRLLQPLQEQALGFITGGVLVTEVGFPACDLNAKDC
jgi:hypothetical protein